MSVSSLTKCHSTVEELRAKVSPELLPLEYGGNGATLKVLNERFREFLRSKRTTLLELDEMEIDLKDPREAAVHEDVGEVVADGAVGSFRKLSID